MTQQIVICMCWNAKMWYIFVEILKYTCWNFVYICEKVLKNTRWSVNWVRWPRWVFLLVGITRPRSGTGTGTIWNPRCGYGYGFGWKILRRYGFGWPLLTPEPRECHISPLSFDLMQLLRYNTCTTLLLVPFFTLPSGWHAMPTNFVIGKEKQSNIHTAYWECTHTYTIWLIWLLWTLFFLVITKI